MDEPIRESGRHLAELLDLSGDGPLYRQIAEELKRAVDRGEVPLGTVLPPERALATELAVSRATVVTAYERLKAEGWLESRQGSGTWVRVPDWEPTHREASSTSRLFIPEQGGTPAPATLAADRDIVDLSAAAVTGTPLVNETLASLTPRDLEEVTAHHGYAPSGLRELRTTVARSYAAQDVPTREEQVLITTGAQQAISLLARVLLEPGDTVLVESPTFPGALDAFRTVGARLIPLPVDEHGARTDLLDDLVERLSPRLLYLSPHFHNPTGAVLPLGRRQQVAELSTRTRLGVIEDMALEGVNLDDVEVPPPLAALAPRGEIISVGSTAKLYWAGLRVGWMRLPDRLTAQLHSAKTVMDLGTSVVSQLLAVRLLERRDEAIEQRRAELVPARDHLGALLDEHLPDWSWQRPPGGLSLWVQLPEGNADEFAEIAAHHGVAIVPGTALSVDEGNRRAVRVVYARPEHVLTEGVRRLALAWRAYQPTVSRPISRLLV